MGGLRITDGVEAYSRVGFVEEEKHELKIVGACCGDGDCSFLFGSGE